MKYIFAPAMLSTVRACNNINEVRFSYEIKQHNGAKTNIESQTLGT